MQERVKNVEIRLILVERISESLNEMTKKKNALRLEILFRQYHTKQNLSCPSRNSSYFFADSNFLIKFPACPFGNNKRGSAVHNTPMRRSGSCARQNKWTTFFKSLKRT